MPLRRVLLALSRRGLHGLSASRASADVIVVGGGHAGCEAAAASARTGADTILITQRADTIGEMSCNPSIGGVGKGHLVREIDALDGLMPKCADEAGIHFRVLNRSRGPAVRGPRAQADRDLYKAAVQRAIGSCKRLQVVEAAVEDLVVDSTGRVTGVLTADGATLHASAVVLTAGTFLRGRVHIGRRSRPAGRFVREADDAEEVEPPTIGIAATLERLGLPLARLKTGTPPRLDGLTINWDHPELVPQPSEDPPTFFSYANTLREAPFAASLVTCMRTATNPRTHELVASSLDHLPLYESGDGDGLGPRYCPSLNVKVARFPEREMHFVWLEPEGLDTEIVYPNGISGAFSEPVQEELVRTIGGLEDARIVRYGYDVEYDFVDPRVLHASLEVRDAAGLFLAGQIIGTTGYEEAAALGIHAGVNAARAALGETTPFVLSRSEAYIGVLVDDLTRRGTMEPYRMFTSRAEHRLLLRADNADARLTERGASVGLVSDARLDAWRVKQTLVQEGEQALHRVVFPAAAWKRAGAPMHPGPSRSAAFALSLSGVELADVERWAAAVEGDVGAEAATEVTANVARTTQLVEAEARETVEVSIKYAEALTLQERSIERVRRSAARTLPEELNYASIESLSVEEVQKLSAARPRTLHEASEISGITPHALACLLSALRQFDEVQRQAGAGRREARTITTKQLRKQMAREALVEARDRAAVASSAEPITSDMASELRLALLDRDRVET
jgi:tRNA uridine 5-carboxymethylaminomethyl modification enzyme